MRSGCRGCGAIAGTIHREAWATRLVHLGTLLDCEVPAGCQLVRLNSAHHPCLGLERHPPYSAVGGEKPVSREALNAFKQKIPLLDYLEAHHWQPVRQLSGNRWVGLCPLHPDRQPSFLVDAGKSLF